MTFEVESKSPREFRPGDIEEFRAAVLEGEEVDPNGLQERILLATALTPLREGKRLLAIAALKNPHPAYRGRVATAMGVALDADLYPFELGWVFVYPTARRKGYSSVVSREVLAHAGNRGVFATFHGDNFPMHLSLEHLGFAMAGEPYPSRHKNRIIQLFTQPALVT